MLVKMVRILIVGFFGLFMMVDCTVGQDTLTFGDQLCPSHHTKCLDTQTCCSIGRGEYGCCPYANATCCRDQRSCCPSGFNCDIASRTCSKSRRISNSRNHMPWIVLQGSSAVNESIVNTVGDGDLEEITLDGKKLCPGPDRQSCPDTYTCCEQVGGSYGCCPLTGGICCPDHVHCCPVGTECNTKLGSCDG